MAANRASQGFQLPPCLVPFPLRSYRYTCGRLQPSDSRASRDPEGSQDQQDPGQQTIQRRICRSFQTVPTIVYPYPRDLHLPGIVRQATLTKRQRVGSVGPTKEQYDPRRLRLRLSSACAWKDSNQVSRQAEHDGSPPNISSGATSSHVGLKPRLSQFDTIGQFAASLHTHTPLRPRNACYRRGRGSLVRRGRRTSRADSRRSDGAGGEAGRR
jgi:hypothetical protein